MNGNTSISNIFDMRWLQNLTTDLSFGRGFLLCMTLGFVVRVIPEVLSYPHPIGFDTIMYSARIKNAVIWNVGGAAIFSMFLFEGILVSLNAIFRTDPFVLLKLATPSLFALNAVGIYYFAKKALDWSVKKAMVSSFFFTFQLSSLRMSWDLQKNMLGAAILLFAMTFVKEKETRRNLAIFVLLSLLVAFSHVLVSAVLLVIVFTMILNNLLKRRKMKALKLLLVILPAFSVFWVSVYAFPAIDYVPVNAVSAQDTTHITPGGLPFLVDYMGVSDPVQDYSGYLDLALHIAALFALLYVVSLPLVLVGFFRHKILDAWTCFLLIGSFSGLVTPFCALDLWNRWMLMLVYPFTFYAVGAIARVNEARGNPISPNFKWIRRIKVSKNTVRKILCATFILGLVYIVAPPFSNKVGVFSIPPANHYFPSTMFFNTVPLHDVDATTKAFEWLNENMSEGSVVLLHRAFLWWADLYLNKNHLIVSYVRDLNRALNLALTRNLAPIFLVWWNENLLTWQNAEFGWYGLIVPKYFIPVFNHGRITVFGYPVG